MSMNDGNLFASQIDYKLRPMMAPRYKFVKLAMSNLASASVGVTNSAAQSLEWLLPANTVYNLSRSYWQYNMNAPGSGNNTSNNNSFEDVFELAQTVSFGAPGSQDIVSLPWVANYTKIARKLNTSMPDYLSNDDMCGLTKSNIINVGNYVPGGGSAAPYLQVTGTGTQYQGTDSNIEPRYMFTGSVAASADPTGVLGRMDRFRQVPLSTYPGTILGVDRDFFSPTQMSLRLLSNIGDKMAWLSTGLANPSNLQASIANTVGVNGCSTAGQGLTINNLYLYLCVETNQNIIDGQFAKYMAGTMRYSIPYTTSFRLTGSGAGAQTNLQVSLSNMYGRKLKRVLTTVWNPLERLSTAYDCSNVHGSKLVSYQTMINSRPLQDRILSCLRPGILAGATAVTNLSSGMDDWLENQKFMDKSTAYTSKEMYGLNWFHCDQFFEPRDGYALPEVNLEEGLTLDAPITWQFSGLSGGIANCVYYIYAEFQRDIIVGPSGPVFAPINP